MITSHRLASFALAAILTVGVMFGIDHLATSDAPAALVAAVKASRA
ncbi:MAG: hypothetical protein JNL30_03960 [Rubrivivax sp.]|nr:hypothetical protein [Rubrivivax sp.]